MVGTSTYELRSGEHRVGLREASTAQQALLDYLRARGCADDEITRLGPDAVSWRGAVYRAVPVSADNPSRGHPS
jgi:hypothetical protein